jgi:hypothetical protein
MTTTKYILILLSCFILSCSQTTKEPEKEIKSTQDKKGVSYYCYELNCFDFVERCDLTIAKLVNFDTLIYVSSSEHFGYYEEFRGKLKQINDSIYYVKCFKSLRQEGMKPIKYPTIDTVGFICDSSLIGKNISITYENKTTEQFKIYSDLNNFPINKNYFNSENEKIKITLDYRNPIVDEKVQIIGQHNSDVCFVSDKKNFYDIYIVIDSNIIKSINLHTDISRGPSFQLKRMPVETKLNKGRKLYGQ